jgi:hypothetical protein
MKMAVPSQQIYGGRILVIRVFVIALMAIYCIAPLVSHKGLPSGHDMVFHIFLADQFNKSIEGGNCYPGWMRDANNGLGNPTLLFYAPLSYYVVSTVNMLVGSMTMSLIIVIWLGFFLSGISMYTAVTKMFRRSGGLFPAVIYQVLPFHLGDLYVRGTFAELFAFVWFPLILLFMHEILRREGRFAIFGLSISYAGLILSHLASAYMFSFVMAGYFIYLYFFDRKKGLFKTGISIIAGLGLSAFYIVPVIFERRYVQIDYLLTCSVCDYRNNFLFMGEGLQSPLGSFYVKLHIAVMVSVLFSILAILMVRHLGGSKAIKGQQNFFIILFFGVFFLTTPLSYPLWAVLPGFPTLQFPWRWIEIMEVALCFMLGGVFSAGKESGNGRPGFVKVAILFILGSLCLISFFIISRSTIFSKELMAKAMDPGEILRFMDPAREYTPIWAKERELILSETKNEKALAVRGTATIDVDSWQSERRVISIRAATDTVIRVATYFYPGWTAEIDGEKMPVYMEETTGAILVNIPAGYHHLVMQFHDTPLRFGAKIVSLCFLMMMVVYAIRQSIVTRVVAYREQNLKADF